MIRAGNQSLPLDLVKVGRTWLLLPTPHTPASPSLGEVGGEAGTTGRGAVIS